MNWKDKMISLRWDGFDWEHNAALIVLDALGYNEFKKAHTPNIDKIADKEWHNAYSPGSFTAPSFQAFMVGHLPSEPDTPCSETQIFGRPLWLPKKFKDNGYRTMAWVSLPYCGSYYGFDRGFDIFNDMRRQNMCKEIVRESIGTIERTEEKFFLMLDIGETHRDFSFDGETTEWKREVLQEYNYAKKDTVSQEYLDYLQERQVKATEFVDKELEPLLNLLKDRNTFIVILSDHGCCHGESHLEGHGYGFHPKQQHVPLIFSLPD